jgi:diguanylate cyclase (GGDEF)-like protein
MKILIVEDSATLRAGMRKMVEAIGHTPLFANSGEEALQLVGNTTFDLVIMDVEMPGLDGFETTTLMREILGKRWIPIIYATGHNSENRALEGIKAGGDDFLVKPISQNLLEAKIISLHRIAEMQKQLAKLNTKLANLSERDGLTQLLNRRCFSEKANQAIKQAKRHNKPCGLLMLDIDFFKQYNDHYGHMAGDECLQAIAASFADVAKRESDLIARYGGEEFILLLPETDLSGSRLVAEKIILHVQALAIPHACSTVSDHVTVSIGVAVSTDNRNTELDSLILEADKYLYRAKELGRNRLVSHVDASKKTLLIATDRKHLLTALNSTLKPFGELIYTDSQSECIELAKELRPDLIVIDQAALTVNAEQMSRTLSQHLRTARIPIIINDENSVSAGATGDKQAPFNDAFIEQVSQLLTT